MHRLLDLIDRTTRIPKPNALAIEPGGSNAQGCLGTPPAACRPCNEAQLIRQQRETFRDLGHVVRAVLCANARFTVQLEGGPHFSALITVHGKADKEGRQRLWDLQKEDTVASQLHGHE